MNAKETLVGKVGYEGRECLAGVKSVGGKEAGIVGGHGCRGRREGVAEEEGKGEEKGVGKELDKR